MLLQETFTELAQQYCADPLLVDACWSEIQKAYTSRKRHYHDLTHLDNLLQEMQGIKELVSDWNTMLFTLYYHDIVYHARKSDNEEKSAGLAVERLRSLQVPSEKISLCHSQVMATRSHAVSADNDTNLFTDADLSILGKEWSLYEKYYKQVRKEYSIYPDLLYKPGRKKVLQHFLDMERIFKTDVFFGKYEKQARENLGKEIDLLA